MAIVNNYLFNNIENYIENHRGSGFELIKQSAGDFLCNHDLIYLPELLITRRSFNLDLSHCGTIDDDHIVFSFPCGKSSFSVNGESVGESDFVMFSPGNTLYAYYPEHSQRVAAVIPLSLLLKHLEPQEFERCKHSAFIKFRDVDSHIRLDKLKKNIIHLFRGGSNSHFPLSGVAVLDLEQEILLSVTRAIQGVDILNRSVKDNNRYRVVNRAVDYLNSTGAYFISMPELSQVSYCSIRTLEYAFKQVLGTTPKQYLINRRMHLIRQHLKSGCVSSISEVCRQFGIVNSGRFSQDYMKMFGESPMQTLEK